MFEKLASLTYDDLISVCHGIFASWRTYPGIAFRLPDNLSQIALEFSETHSELEYKELLINYVNERINKEVKPELRLSGERFLESIL